MLFRSGVSALSKIDSLQIATELMSELTHRSGLVSVLAVWGSHGPTVVRWEVGNLEAAIHVREGINLSLITTAAGQIFLAFLAVDKTREQLERDIRTWNATAPASKRFTKARAAAMRDTVQKAGLARAVAMRNPLVSAISAPIFDRNGLLMSLTLTGIKDTFDDSLGGIAAQQLLETADKISLLLGGASSLARASTREIDDVSRLKYAAATERTNR